MSDLPPLQLQLDLKVPQLPCLFLMGQLNAEMYVVMTLKFIQLVPLNSSQKYLEIPGKKADLTPMSMTMFSKGPGELSKNNELNEIQHNT